MLSLAKKIVQLRKERNLTQKELASIVGVHFSHMSRYERGISLPPFTLPDWLITANFPVRSRYSMSVLAPNVVMSISPRSSACRSSAVLL